MSSLASYKSIERQGQRHKPLPPLLKPDLPVITHSALSPTTPLDTMPTAELTLKKRKFSFQHDLDLEELDEWRTEETDEDSWIDDPPIQTQTTDASTNTEANEENIELDLFEGKHENSQDMVILFLTAQ